MRLPFDVTVVAGRRFINLWPEIATAILRTVEAGWTLALQSSQLSTSAGEVEITERLRDGMRCALNSGRFSWSKLMAVPPGTESRSRPEVFVPDGRIDIPILWIDIIRFGEHDPHAIIECKRVSGGDARLCREYVVAGIDRFQTGQYSENHSAVFMVGYLIADNPETTVAGINRNLNHRSRSAENLRPSNLTSEPWVWGSLHPRTNNNSPIELHHAFLAFTES